MNIEFCIFYFFFFPVVSWLFLTTSIFVTIIPVSLNSIWKMYSCIRIASIQDVRIWVGKHFQVFQHFTFFADCYTKPTIPVKSINIKTLNYLSSYHTYLTWKERRNSKEASIARINEYTVSNNKLAEHGIQ